MATNSSSQTNNTSEGSSTSANQTPQPLSQKSHDQLKRETRARLRHLDPETASELLNESVGKQVGGFLNFLREHAIVGLAVGFVLATQVQTVVKQLINSFIEPLFQLITGKDNLNNLSVTVHFNGHSQPFGWGAFVYTLIDFIFVALTIYIIIKIFNLDKLDKTK